MSKKEIKQDQPNMVRIVNLDNYSSPEIKEVKNRKFVLYGNKNSFWKDLIDRTTGSTTNGTAVSSISRLVYGKGLNATNKAQKPNEWAELMTILKPKDIKKAIADMEAMGMAALQCQWKGDHAKIKSATHLPMNKLAPEKLEEGAEAIEAWYYADDWTKVRQESDAKRIPVLGTSKEGLEIIIIRPYQAGAFYFAYPKWFPAFQWCMTEEEISNYHLNAIQNSFAPSLYISLNNGIPATTEKADEIVSDMMKKYKGSSNAGRVIVSFAANKESESTVTPISLSDAPEQYAFLSEEAERKIMSAHAIPSPLLIGIPSKSGFSSNADELKTASILMDTNVLNPDRELLIEAFEEIISYNKLALNLEFESLNPFQDEVGIDISTDDKEDVPATSEVPTTLSEDFNLDSLGEEHDGSKWILIDSREVDYEQEDNFNAQLVKWNDELTGVQLASTGTARPNAKSEQDAEVDELFFKTRYVYDGDATGEREFCSKMVAAKKLYRKEDIDIMSKNPVNQGFGKNGAATYDIFLYKGGARCHHKWLRQTFLSKTKSVDVKSPLAKKISTNQARGKYKYVVKNPKEVSMKPIDMPHLGFHPANPDKPSDAK